MAESAGAGSRGRWTAAECPFVIEYDITAMDDIRLAVTDAFFSLPRGGAEIGGVLLGEYADGRLSITGYLPLECEHAYGPGFTLSPNDHARLAALIASAPKNGADVVGWYHSHTRSEIMLTDHNLEVYNRYFPHAFQVALVMKPSSFQPARCGFFFRERGGRIRADASYNEFELQAQAVTPAPSSDRQERRVRHAPEPEATAHRQSEPEPHVRRHVLTLDAVLKNVPHTPPLPPTPSFGAVESAAAPALAPEPPAPVKTPLPPPEPSAPTQPQESKVSGLYWLALTILVLILAYQTREYWLGSNRPPAPAPAASVAPAPAPIVRPASALALAVSDAAGQLQIRWDGAATFVQSAAKGSLEIDDGEHKAIVPLNADRLRAGSFTYARESQSVDVRLSVEDPSGRRLHEAASFFGKLPERPAAVSDPGAAKERDLVAQEAARLRAALAAQTERANRLEKSLEETRRQMKKDQQRRRLENQLRDPLQ
jgi:hypothetical protein